MPRIANRMITRDRKKNHTGGNQKREKMLQRDVNCLIRLHGWAEKDQVERSKEEGRGRKGSR